MFCESLLFVGCDDVKLSEAVVLSDVVRAIHVDGAVLHQPAQLVLAPEQDLAFAPCGVGKRGNDVLLPGHHRSGLHPAFEVAEQAPPVSPGYAVEDDEEELAFHRLNLRDG